MLFLWELIKLSQSVHYSFKFRIKSENGFNAKPFHQGKICAIRETEMLIFILEIKFPCPVEIYRLRTGNCLYLLKSRLSPNDMVS